MLDGTALCCVLFGTANISRYFEISRVLVRKLERNIYLCGKIKDYEHRGTHQPFGTTYELSRKKAVYTKCGDKHT